MPDKVALIARITARPDAVDEVEATLRTLVDAAAEEPGTVAYVLNREGESGSFWFYELYADQAALDAHGQNPALGQAFATLGGLLAEPPEMHLLTPLQAAHLPL
jgi:quinol monooxygenase YgiN